MGSLQGWYDLKWMKWPITAFQACFEPLCEKQSRKFDGIVKPFYSPGL